jgi:hypothetical protein
MALEFTKINDKRYESTNGQYAIVSDRLDSEDWHILNENDKVVGGCNGDIDLAIFSARVLAKEVELPKSPPLTQ